MEPRADQSASAREGLHAALLDYAQSPGKYPAANRQPAVLFASAREILQIAVGRAPQHDALREAARFFVGSAMLHAAADHYGLLGLPRDADGAALKDHYRLLMRLIHPDFAGADTPQWPADSAVRVNMAYDVLSSPVRRREYDAGLASTAPRVQPVRKGPRRIDPPRRAGAGTVSRSGYKTIVVVCAAAGGLVLTGLFMNSRDGVHLVQRQTAPIETAPKEPAPLIPQQPTFVAAPAPAPALVLAILERLPLLAAAKQPPLPEPAVEIAPRVARVVPAPPPVAAAPKTPLAAAPTPRPLPVANASPVEARVPATVVAAAPVASPRVASPPAASQPAIAVAVPVPVPVAVAPAPLPRPAPVPGLSLAEAQPLLAVLLQHLESGRGERLVNMLEREARGHPGAQALSRHYERLIDGMRPVRLSHVEFRAEPADGRLLVIGNIGLQGGEQSGPGKKIVVRAEFASRAGNIVMVGLSGEPGN